MSKIFLYGRVSTSQQTLEQQERTAYEWLKAHGMSVDEVVTDEGVSGGVSYADRNLGKVLLPKMQEGDMIIVSEVSRLGRSMYDLSKLIHTELKPRKLRLVVACMGIDLNCAKITPIDQLILSNFAFAAELEKHLIRERTLSALAVKKQQGVKLGGAAGAWIENYNKKSNIEKHEIGMRRGATKNERHLLSRDVQAFIKALRSVFPDACKGDVTEWDFSAINTKETARIKLLSLMRDYKSFDNTLFVKWDLSGDDLSARPLQVKLAAQIQSLRNSVKKLNENKDNEKGDAIE
jgi:DNA invertase Pin-like site-specific DNA recombinase